MGDSTCYLTLQSSELGHIIQNISVVFGGTLNSENNINNQKVILSVLIGLQGSFDEGCQ